MAALALATTASCGVDDADSPEDTAVAQSALTHGRHRNPNPALFERDARPFGFAMDTWVEQWWRWDFSIPASTNPSVNATTDCDQHQAGPVFFVPTVAPGAATERTCTIPRHRAIGLSLSTVVNEFPCPDPTFKPGPGQTLFEFLLEGARPPQDAITEIDVSLDGQPLNDLLSYRVSSNHLTHITGDLSLQPLDSCITGSPQPAAMDAYFLMFKQLPPGHHTVTTRLVLDTGKIRGPLTYHLVVGDD
jgi:hypothetical protein